MKRLVFAFLLLAGSLSASPITYQLPRGLGQVWDSGKVHIRDNGILRSTSTFTNKDTLNRSVTFGLDTIGTVAIELWNSTDSHTIWTPIQTNGRFSDGPVLWWTPNKWEAATDSFQVRAYANNSMMVGFPRSYTDGRQTYDTLWAADEEITYNVFIDIWFAGDTSRNTVVWSLYYDSLGGGSSTIGVPPASPMAAIEGCIRKFNDSGLYKATVIIEPDNADFATDTTAGIPRIFVASPSITTTTLVNGCFSMGVVGSDQFDKSQSGYYRVTIQYRGKDIIRVPRLWVPAGTTLNIGDSLAVRQ